MNTQHDEKTIKQRRFLVFLPLLTLPFLLLAFWALGGGSTDTSGQQEKGGLNLNLPAADLEEDEQNKLSLYQQAEKDSLLRQEQLRMDPYAQMKSVDQDTSRKKQRPARLIGMDEKPARTAAQKVEKKLAELQKVIQSSEPKQHVSQPRRIVPKTTTEPEFTEDLDRLESMMQHMSEPVGEDPEIQQLEQMLDKILDVQHPQRVRQRLEAYYDQQRGATFSVDHQAGATEYDRYSQQSYYTSESNGFYGLDENESRNGIGIRVKPAIQAVVHETQTLVSGATLKMELTQDVYINGVRIPKGTLVFGQCAVEGERLQVAVEGIRYEDRIFPVKLRVHSLDALPGIRVPGAIPRKVAKEGADDALQGLSVTSFDPSLEMQAASAGIETAKGLFSKKVKLVRVTVKAGHPVLLLDKNQNQ